MPFPYHYIKALLSATLAKTCFTRRKEAQIKYVRFEKKKCTDTSVSLTAVMAFDIEMLFMGAARINMDTDPTVGLK